MSAAKVNLGTFGIIYDIVLRVEKDTNIHTVNCTIDFSKLIGDEGNENHGEEKKGKEDNKGKKEKEDNKGKEDNKEKEDNKGKKEKRGREIGKLLNNSEWLEFYWFPFSKSVLVKESTRTNENISWFTNISIYVNFFIQAFISTFQAYMSYYLFSLSYKFVKHAGANNYVMFSSCDKIQPLRYGVHYTGLIDYNPIICNPECTIGFNNNAEGYAKIAQCISDSRDLIDTYYNRGMAPCVYGINVRFTAASECLISPAAMDYDLIMWIEAFVVPGMKGYEEFCDNFNSLMINKYQGMCHWPKSWNYTSIDTITQNYGHRLLEFNKIRNDLGVDPTNMFLNPTLRSILQC